MRHCGGRHFCPGCDQELIHRDHRKAWESASAFGQVVWREGPSRLTTGDIDHYAWKSLPGGAHLLRLVEHKQPDAKLKEMQQKVLLILDAVLAHAADCPTSGVRLDPRSAVYVMRGKVLASEGGMRETRFRGPQTITRAHSSFDEHDTFTRRLNEPEDVFRWLEGTPDGVAGGPRRRQRLPAPAQLDLEREVA